MLELPAIGKVSPDVFASLIYPRLGHPRPEVLVGPRNGVDVAIVDLGAGRVLATTCDPVFVVPQFGFRRAAWFAVHILASDAAMSGLAPAYMAIDLNLPLAITKNELTELWDGMHQTCADLGIAIVSGHTARYEGCAYPMVGGATVMAVGDADSYVASNMARPGDVLICTKGAAIEATALFGVTFPEALAAAIGPDLAGRAAALFEKMTVVSEARVAAAYGVRDKGVTTLHDATEGGVVGGIFEIAQASGVGVRFDEQAVPIRPEVEAVCRLVGIDPLTAISEGTLLATVRPEHAAGVVEALEQAGSVASVIGEIVTADRGMVRLDGRTERTLEHPRIDPFWAAYGRALESGL